MNNLARCEESKSFPRSLARGNLGRVISMRDRAFNPRPAGVIQNDLLAGLPAHELAALLPHLELVELPFGQQLFEHGSQVSHAYFPSTAIIASLYMLADGALTQIGVTGHEGLVGMSIVVGEREWGTAKVQSAGYAYKIKASALKNACAHENELPRLLMKYTHFLLANSAQNAVCNQHYSIDQQLSRWLLERLDRMSCNALKVTQELIANMLGVRRESISEAAGRLQRQGLIKSQRGSILVLDRAGLETYAGECYRVVKREFDLMLAHVTCNPCP